MIFFFKYIEQFQEDGTPEKKELAARLSALRRAYDVFNKGNPEKAFPALIDTYNWMGQPTTKARYGITENLARNLPGAMFQDYLLHLAIKLCTPYPTLETFTEVRVMFGKYPLWSAGEVAWKTPAEHSDLAIGYIMDGETIAINKAKWPKQPFYSLPIARRILPLVTVNTKIRVSQSEFFDWHGREQLMTKGNPHCMSIQVVLRKEMDLSIVEAAQAGGKFFLLGEGGERTVTPRTGELTRLIQALSEHLADRMRGEAAT